MKVEIENKGKALTQNTFIATDDEKLGIYSWWGFDHNELFINENFYIFTIEQLEALKEVIDRTLIEYKKLYNFESEEKQND